MIRYPLMNKNLSFTYPDGTKPVLSDINVHVKQGEMLGILGVPEAENHHLPTFCFESMTVKTA